jgi:hypothetical protein
MSKRGKFRYSYFKIVGISEEYSHSLRILGECYENNGFAVLASINREQ